MFALTLRLYRKLQLRIEDQLLAVGMRGATLVLSVASVGMTAPFLGPNDLGRFALMQTLMAWTGIANLGLIEACSGILSKFNSRRCRATGANYIGASFKAAATAALVLTLIFSMAAAVGLQAGWLSGRDVTCLSVGVGCALLSVPFTLAQAPLNADGAVKRSTAWTFATVTANLTILAILIQQPIASDHRLLAVSVATGLTTLLGRIATFRVETNRVYGGQVLLLRRTSARQRRLLLHAGWPFVIISLSALAAFQIDRVVAFAVLSPADAARLDILLKILMALYTLYAVVLAKLWHTVGKPWNENNAAAARQALSRAVRQAALYWLIMGGAMLIGIDTIVHFFTKGTLEVEDPFLVLAAVLFMATRTIVDAVSISIFALRCQHLTIRAVVAHGVINVPCSVVGGMTWGLTGILVGQWFALLVTTGWRFPLIFVAATKDPGP